MVITKTNSLNYIIQAHNFPNHLKRLISRLNEDYCFFYIHIDKKSNVELFKKELKEFNNVIFVEERVDVGWGDISQVEATLNCIKQVLKDKRAGYCILMSGQDYPIKSNNDIKNFFEFNYGYNFIESRPVEEVWGKDGDYRLNDYNFHPDSKNRKLFIARNIFSSRFYRISSLKHFIKKQLLNFEGIRYLKYSFKKRKQLNSLRPFGGSQWWAIPMETINRIMGFVETNGSFLKFHKYTHCPDEIFFHTLISNLFDSKTIKNSVTYVNWSKKVCGSPITFESKDDFAELSKAEGLFARKFIENSEILDKIDANLLAVRKS